MTLRWALVLLIAAAPAAAAAQGGPEDPGPRVRLRAESVPSQPPSAFSRGLQRELERERQGAAYGVATVPLNARTDIFARAGYGASQFRAFDQDSLDGSWRFGLGAKVKTSSRSDLRADFTRQDFRKKRAKANIFSFGYTRRF